jgi:hypothetical protein
MYTVSVGFRTINWALVNPGSASTASLSATRRKTLGLSAMVV